jgi:hypothetical protein
MFSSWAIERLSYWTLFALMVLSIERVVRDMNWDMLKDKAIKGNSITAITLLGITLLFIWVIFH